MSTGVDPTWKADINKKIAQLTKTVFRLHSDSMDHRDSLNELKDRYQEEINEIMARGKEHLENLQKDADSFHPAIENVVSSEFKTKFDQTKQQFEAAKNNIYQQTEKLINIAKKELNETHLKLEQMKKKISNDKELYKNTITELNELKTKCFDIIDRKANKVISKHVNEANAKYEAAVQITQKKQKELSDKYNKELDDLKNSLDSSKISSEDTVNQTLKKMEEKISELSSQKVSLIQCVQEFSDKSSTHFTEMQKILKQAEEKKAKVIEIHQNDLKSFQNQLQKIQSDHENEVKKLKEVISSDEVNFINLMKQKNAELEQISKKSQQIADEYEALSQKATKESEEKNEKLKNGQKELLEKFEKEKLAYIEREHKNTHIFYRKIIELEKEHQKKADEIRSQLDCKYTDYISLVSKLMQKQKEEIKQMKTENKQQFELLKKNLVQTGNNYSDNLKEILVRSATLKSGIMLSKFEFNKDMEEIDENKKRQMKMIQNEHEAKLESLNLAYEQEIKEIDQKSSSLYEKTKKQFLIEMKFAEERSEIDIKHTIEMTNHQIELKRQKSIEEERDRYENELASLSQDIQAKTIEKKNFDQQLKDDLTEYAHKTSELQKEVKTLESNWIEEKQKYTADWTEKFEKISAELNEEAKQNEEIRKYNEKKCQQTVEHLKAQMQVEEESLSKELSKVNRSYEEEKTKGETEINELKQSITNMSNNRTDNIESLQKTLEKLEEDSLLLIEKENSQKESEIQKENKITQEYRKKAQQEIQQLKTTFIEKKNENDKKILDMKIKSEQNQIDFQYLIDDFEFKKNVELELLKIRHNFELDLFGIELTSLQEEAERIQTQENNNIGTIKELQVKCIEELNQESSQIKTKVDTQNQIVFSEKSKLIEKLNQRIASLTNIQTSQKPRIEDLENIEKLEEILNERNEECEMLDSMIKRMEGFMIEHELHFWQLKTEKKLTKPPSPPTIVAPVAQTASSSSKRLKKENSVTILSSQRKLPGIMPTTPNRKNRVPA